MKTITVTGGKGGVGKSTFFILLANKLRSEGKKVVLVDLDVECPNDHLLLGQELGEIKEKVFAKFPKLNKKKCTKCGLCVQKCPDNAIFQKEGDYPIFMHDLCASCGLCWNLCPVGAIDVEEKVTGEVFVSAFAPIPQPLGLETGNPKGFPRRNSKDHGDVLLVTGRSVGIVEETGPIVAKVREYARELAEDAEADYFLLDTAPGLHCAVVRALWDVDEAYAVTEPTPLGAHDLKLLLELLEKLGVPAKIVLNQADLGNRELIEPIVNDFNTAIAHEIPYSKDIVDAYSRGQLGSLSISQIGPISRIK